MVAKVTRFPDQCNSKYELRRTKYKAWESPAFVRPLNFVLPTFLCTLYIVFRTFS
jgi:hypothetical protein